MSLRNSLNHKGLPPKKSAGRPKLAATIVRGKVVSIRFTRREFDSLERLAGNQKVPTFSRAVILAKLK